MFVEKLEISVGPRRLALALACLAGILVLGCGRQSEAPPPARSSDQESHRLEGREEGVGGPFVEITDEVGVDFVHWNGMSGGYFYSEMMGSGVAAADFDADGDIDLFFVQGSMLGDKPASEASFPLPAHGLGDRLYRNDLIVGELDGSQTAETSTAATSTATTSTLRFQDVTAQALAGIEPGYGMGVAVADFDGDSWPDLYITRTGKNQHLRNVGDGSLRFEDVTDGVSGSSQWGVPAVPADLDQDGDVDLWIGNYVAYSVAIDKRCPDELGQPNYCGPLAYPPVADQILLNRGDGSFEDVSARAGITREYGAALGGTVIDVNSDGKLDIFVANDGSPNLLWVSLGLDDGGIPRFENRALLTGAAVSGRGQAEASMGVATADVDGDLAEDLFLTHLTRETNTLYRADGLGGFTDRSAESGLGAPSYDRTAFGAAFLDLEHDGDLDLVTVNGAVKVIKEQVLAGEKHPLWQPDQFFRASSAGLLVEEEAGPSLSGSGVGRGLVTADLDNDGDLDLVITENAGEARILENREGDGHPWLGLILADSSTGPATWTSAPGALAILESPSGAKSLRRVGGNASYASSSDPRLHFGLGDWPEARSDGQGDSSAVEAGGSAEGQGLFSARVRWPDGSEELFLGIPPFTYTELRRGVGSPDTQSK